MKKEKGKIVKECIMSGMSLQETTNELKKIDEDISSAHFYRLKQQLNPSHKTRYKTQKTERMEREKKERDEREERNKRNERDERKKLASSLKEEIIVNTYFKQLPEERKWREYRTDVGNIDILVEHPKAIYVLEFKRDKTSDAVLGQILRYMGWLKLHLKTEKPIYGVIIAKEIDERLKYAVSGIKDVETDVYSLWVDLTLVKPLTKQDNKQRKLSYYNNTKKWDTLLP